jgi:hypothetical protein
MGRKSKQPLAEMDWATPGGRVRWLLANVWQGNRLAMAEDISVSHTAINKVASKAREPGRRLLAAIAGHPKVNPAWLLTGQGAPLLEAADDARDKPVPVARQLLPGPPQQNAELLSGDALDHGHLFLPTQYWLRLQPGQPLLEDPEYGFLLNDLLLLESDRRRFPRVQSLHGWLCVVRLAAADPGREPVLKLGAVDYHQASPGEPEKLEVDTFDLDLPRERRVTRLVVDRFPGGKYRLAEQELELTTFRGQERAAERSMSYPRPKPKIAWADVVGVWLGILHRPGGVLVE